MFTTPNGNHCHLENEVKNFDLIFTSILCGMGLVEIHQICFLRGLNSLASYMDLFQKISEEVLGRVIRKKP